MATSAAARRMSKQAYENAVTGLRDQLIQLQVALKGARYKILLIMAGEESAGRGEVINTLGSWLDPRGVETFSFREPSDEERERPLLWRYWRCLPTLGRIGIFANSWYSEALRAAAQTASSPARIEHELTRIRHFEKLLADNGTLVVKVWLHLSKAEQRQRLEELSADPDTAWRVKEEDWQHHRSYDRLARIATHMREATQQPGAPWHVIDAADPRARNLALGRLLLRRHAAHGKRAARLTAPPGPPAQPPVSLRPAGLRRLLSLPLDQTLAPGEYEEKREKWLGRLNQNIRAAQAAGRSVVFVFEGWDAAGKGGAIRRLTSAIDARDYRVIPIAKPTDEEKSHHYLWRFWRHVPRAGLISIYDRSWYGRVLVERLEGFCREDEWRRAFTEMNDFEEQLTEHGIIVVKFWMHVSQDEQLRRFREREQTTYKNHKINAEDWRNREKWAAYEVAVGDMLALTDTAYAPWHLIPANHKQFARLQILRIAAKSIEDALTRPPGELPAARKVAAEKRGPRRKAAAANSEH